MKLQILSKNKTNRGVKTPITKINIMKKTKTGLHIETRKNRIEVYTKADLQQREKELIEQRELIKLAAMIGLAITLVGLGFIFGLSV